MLFLTFFFTIIDNGDCQWLKGPRIFSFFAFIGAIVLSALDTGYHESETSTYTDGGSSLWYATVGFCGTFSLIALEHSSSYHFLCDYNWPIYMSMALFTYSNQQPALLVFSSLILVAYGLWVEKEGEEYQDEKVRTEITTITETKSLKDDATAQEDIASNDQYNRQQYENIGTAFLLIAVLISDIQDSQNGVLLAMMSTAVIKYGTEREKTSFQGVIGTLGWCIATFLIFSKNHFLAGVINMPIRMTIVLILATILLGGWKEKIASSKLSIPPKTLKGIYDALVSTTLLLLLLLCIVGNSNKWSDWKFMMDFGYFKLVDGGYSYHNRGIYILPWCTPLFIYYRTLYQSWPEQEKKFARYRVPENGVSILVVLHVMRLVSWAELYLIVALLMSLWPKIKGLLLGKKQ